MNKLQSGRDPPRGPTPFSPSSGSSPRLRRPFCPTVPVLGPQRGRGGAEVGSTPRPAGPDCPKAVGCAAWHWLCPAAAPACHSSLGTTTWQLKPAQRDAFSSPRETLFLWEEEEEALRSGSDPSRHQNLPQSLPSLSLWSLALPVLGTCQRLTKFPLIPLFTSKDIKNMYSFAVILKKQNSF